MTRKSLTDSFPEVFIWLRNHDKEWLYKHLPKALTASQAQSHRYKHQHDLWKNRQRKAIKELRSFARKAMAAPPKNQRLSISYILKTHVTHPSSLAVLGTMISVPKDKASLATQSGSSGAYWPKLQDEMPNIST